MQDKKADFTITLTVGHIEKKIYILALQEDVQQNISCRIRNSETTWIFWNLQEDLDIGNHKKTVASLV